MAQSSVEIYGYLDVGVAKMKGGQLGVNNTGYVTPPSQATTGLTNSFARSGLTTNFIGFGLDLTSEEPLPVDFLAADDTVTLAITGGADYAPTYTAVVGHADRETLSWVDTTP